MKSIAGFILLAILICFTSVTHGQVYEWTDENGNRQFSDQPPSEPGTDIQKKSYDVHNIDEGLPEPIVADPTRISREVEDREAKKKRLARSCKEARETFSIVSHAVRYRNENGDVVYVSEKERQQHVVQLQADIKRYCRE